MRTPLLLCCLLLPISAFAFNFPYPTPDPQPDPDPPSGSTCDIGVYNGSTPAPLNLSGNLVTHDPTIIEENGTYYILQTGSEADGLVLPGKRSSNLTYWEGTRGAFQQGNTPSWLRPAYRHHRVPGERDRFLGFRVVLPA